MSKEQLDKIAVLESINEKLERLSRLQDRLLVCYRIGRRPPGSIIDGIRECKEWLDSNPVKY